MVEKLEGTGRVYTLSHDDDASGVRENPWAAHLRRPASATAPGGLYEALVAQTAPRVLGRFERLDRDDRAAVLAAAADRLSRSRRRPPWPRRASSTPSPARPPRPTSAAGAPRSAPTPARSPTMPAPGGGPRRSAGASGASSRRCARSTTLPPATRWGRSCCGPPSPSRCGGTRPTRTSPGPGARSATAPSSPPGADCSGRATASSAILPRSSSGRWRPPTWPPAAAARRPPGRRGA